MRFQSVFFILTYLANVVVGNFDISDVFDLFDIKTPIDVRTAALKETQCYDDIKRYLKDLARGEHWATQMYDASEKISPGLLAGKRILYGDFDECLSIESPYNFDGQFCLVSINTTQDLFEHRKIPFVRYPEYLVGYCFPSSCSQEYLNQVIQDAYIPSSDKNVSEYARITIEPGNCQNKNQEVPYTTLNYFTISVIAALMGIVMLSTAFDAYFEISRSKELTIVTAFSLIRNGKVLFYSNKISNGANGIRAITALLVLYAHLSYFMINGNLSNLRMAKIFIDADSGILYHVNFYLTVDVFLLLSGMNTMRSFLIGLNKRRSYNAVFAIIKRYFRLVIPFSIIILIRVGISEHFHTGPVYNEFNNFYRRKCNSTIISQLLCYDNFKTKLNDMCFEHAWYIPTEIQLFVFSQLILIFGMWKPNALLKTTIFMCIASSLIEFYIAYANNLSFSYTCDPENKTMELFYSFPYTRGTQYYQGLILGCLVYKYDKLHYSKMIKSSVVFAGLLAVLFAFYIIVYTDCDNFSQPESAFFLVYRKLFFTTGMGAILFICLVDSNGLITRVLSFPPLPFLAKISYEIYLIHSVIIQFNIASSRETIYITDLRTVFMGCDVLCVTIVLATIMNLTVTNPSMILVENLKKYLNITTIRYLSHLKIEDGKNI